MEIQIFGVKKSSDTRHALRFFAERRIRTHFVDLLVRPASPGELERFIRKFGIEGVLDRAAPRFQALGLASAHRGEEWWIRKLAEEPLLLRMPLTRFDKHLTIGRADEEWRGWVQR